MNGWHETERDIRILSFIIYGRALSKAPIILSLGLME